MLVNGEATEMANQIKIGGVNCLHNQSTNPSISFIDEGQTGKRKAFNI